MHLGRRNTTRMSNVRRSPLARSADLVVEEVADEVLVYDLARHRAHSLGATAARVWRRCDGTTAIDDLGADLGLDADTVTRALAELAECELLDASTAPVRGTTRRELAIRAAKTGAAVASVPLIVSVVAPLPVQAATLGHCLALGGEVGNCGNACCQGNTGCCCCLKVNSSPAEKTCVPTELCERNFYQPLPKPGEPDTGHCSCRG